jgi:hypothetical protein
MSNICLANRNEGFVLFCFLLFHLIKNSTVCFLASFILTSEIFVRVNWRVILTEIHIFQPRSSEHGKSICYFIRTEALYIGWWALLWRTTPNSKTEFGQMHGVHAKTIVKMWNAKWASFLQLTGTRGLNTAVSCSFASTNAGVYWWFVCRRYHIRIADGKPSAVLRFLHGFS